MGSGRWDAHTYDSLTSKSAFTYHRAATRAAAATGDRLKVHSSLDPSGLKVRESRDNDEHPRSRAVAVWLDGTGSNKAQAEIVFRHVPELMGLLVRRGYVSDPQVLFGVIGDYHAGDDLPLQVGQFESDNRIEIQLGNAVLEGGGGGGFQESYELALYALARHTAIDCFEKRGEKGYCFIVGDELPYPTVSREAVQAVFGEVIQADVSTRDIVQELQERYDVYVIIPARAQHGREARMLQGWAEYVGQNVLRIEDADQIVARMAAEIGANEGVDHAAVLADLYDAGADEHTLAVISTDLARRPAPVAPAVVADGDLRGSGAPSGTTRL
jgi:hypothetical protein